MFERFTERARQVVVLAQEEARALGHGHIGTEHILLGVLRESDGLGARALKSLDLSLPDLRADVIRLTVAPELPPGAPSPFTPLAKRVLESALREALNLSHNYIGTEHVLLGMMDVSDGLAAKILLEHGVDQEMVSERVSSMLAASQEQRIQRVVSTGAGFRSATISSSRSGPGALAPSEVLAFLVEIAREIREQLGREPDVADYLVALASVPGSFYEQLLAELGTDAAKLAEASERARSAARSALGDLTPDAAVRQARAHLGLDPTLDPE